MIAGESKWTDYVCYKTEQDGSNCIVSDVFQGVLCSNFDRDAEYLEVFTGFSSAPGKCLNRALNLAFQALSIACVALSLDTVYELVDLKPFSTSEGIVKLL